MHLFVAMPLDVSEPGRVGAQVRALFGNASPVTLTEMIEASRSWDVQLKMIGDARDLDAATAELMQLSQ